MEAEKLALTRELGHYKNEARKAIQDKKEVEERLQLQEELAMKKSRLG